MFEALRTIAADSPQAAVRLIERVESALMQIKEFPDSGRRVPEFPESPYREVVVPPYRLFYRRQVRGLIVVALWHEAQLPTDPASD